MSVVFKESLHQGESGVSEIIKELWRNISRTVMRDLKEMTNREK
jgi:hypothetical protein